MKHIIRRTKDRTALTIFILLAYTITWSTQIIALLLVKDSNLKFSNELNFLHFLNLLGGTFKKEDLLPFLLFSFGFGPTISGILTTTLFYGKEGIRAIWEKLTKVKISLKWYLLAILIPLLLNIFSLIIGYFANSFSFGTYNPLLPWNMFGGFLIYMIIFTGFAEEIGWRGFAHDLIRKDLNAYKTSVLLGTVWAIWHLPMTIYANLSNPGVIPLVVIGLIAGTIGWTIINTWLYENSKSLLLIILLHGIGNTLQSYLLLSFDNYFAQMVFGFAPWIIATILTKKYGEETLSVRRTSSKV